MYSRYEIVQIVEGRLFDEEWYERTGAFASGLDAQSGFYALLWPLEEAKQHPASTASLLGPFPDARVARSQARSVLAGVAAAERATELRVLRADPRDAVRGA